MSRSLAVRKHARVLLVGALTCGALAALPAAPSSAAFTTGKCLGDPISGQGASFAASAHNNVWKIGFPTFCADVGTTPTVTYNSTGSGSGRRVMGERTNGSPEGDNRDGTKARNQGVRFGMSEEPPSESGQSQINEGTNAVGDEGIMRLIPGALGAVAIAVNLPDGCTIFEQADGTALTAGQQAFVSDYSATENNQRRLQLTRDRVERAFNGDSDLDTWGELVPHINDGNDTPGEATDTRCQTFPLVRVRRLDDGGTTFVLKDYLNELNPARGWRPNFVTNPDTRNWPNATRTASFDYTDDGDTADTLGSGGAAGTVCGSASLPNQAGTVTQTTSCAESAVPLLQTTPVAPSAGNGNDNLIDHVNDFDGSIGYGDLSTVRTQRSSAFERQTGADDRYWIKVETRAAGAYADPQSSPTGFQAGGAKGSNCQAAQLRNVPGGDDPTVASWAAVSAVDSPGTAYGACSLTYFIAFDDYSGPYSGQGAQDAEERKARTVRDYLEHTVSSTGQSGLSGFDYSPLPNAAQELALAATRKIGWQESAGTNTGNDDDGGTNNTNTGGGGGGGGTPPGATPPPPVVIPPANRFVITSARASRGTIVLSIQVPGPGAVRATGSGRSRGRTLAGGSAGSTSRAGGVVRLVLTPSRALRSALRRGSVPVRVQVAFTPVGGQEARQTVSVRLPKTKAAKKKKARKKSTRRSRQR